IGTSSPRTRSRARHGRSGSSRTRSATVDDRDVELAAGSRRELAPPVQLRPLESTWPVASAALKPASMSRFTPFTDAAAGEPKNASTAATSRGATALPFISLMFQSTIASLVVLRKSGRSGVSIGPGQTLFVRTPRRIVRRDERSVYSSTISLGTL